MSDVIFRVKESRSLVWDVNTQTWVAMQQPLLNAGSVTIPATVTVTGSVGITADLETEVTVTDTINSLSDTATLAIQGRPYIGISLNNATTFSGWLMVEFSTDGGSTWDERLFHNGDNWVAVDALPHAVEPIRTYSVASTPADTHVRVKALTYTSGSTSVTLRANRQVDMNAVIAGIHAVAQAPPTPLGALNDAIETVIWSKSVGFYIRTGTLVGTLTVETSPDSHGSTTWVPVLFFAGGSWQPLSWNVTSPNTAGAISVPVTGGDQRVRLRVSAYTSGSVTAIVRSSQQDDAIANLYNAAISGTGSPFFSTAIGGDDSGTHRKVAVDSSGNLKVSVSNFPASQAVTGTFWQATQPVSLASVPSHAVTNAGTFAVQAAQSGTWTVTGLGGTFPVTGTFWQATQPISGTVTANAGTNLNTSALALDASISTLTTAVNTLLKPANTLTAVTAITNVVHVDDNSGSMTVDAPVATPVFVRLSDGAAAIATLPVSNAGLTNIDVALSTRLKPADTLAAVTTVTAVTSLTQMNGQAIAMGTGTRSAGTQRVTVATDDVVPVTNANLDVALSTRLKPADTLAAVTSITNAVTITPPTLTKGTQGATGISTQDLKDAGRSQVMLTWEEMAGTAAAESTLTNFTLGARAGSALTAATNMQVSASKTLRIQSITYYSKATSTVNNLCRFRIRMAGTVANTSPVIFDAVQGLEVTGTIAAGAMARDTISFPDGLEVAAGQQIAFTWFTAANTCTVGMSIVGYEY